jgi:hypothetical protein
MIGEKAGATNANTDEFDMVSQGRQCRRVVNDGGSGDVRGNGSAASSA